MVTSLLLKLKVKAILTANRLPCMMTSDFEPRDWKSRKKDVFGYDLDLDLKVNVKLLSEANRRCKDEKFYIQIWLWPQGQRSRPIYVRFKVKWLFKYELLVYTKGMQITKNLTFHPTMRTSNQWSFQHCITFKKSSEERDFAYISPFFNLLAMPEWEDFLICWIIFHMSPYSLHQR